jgi:nodulation protein E
MKRVVITGMGSISGLGQGVEPSWATAIAGEIGVRHLKRVYQDAYEYEGPAANVQAVDTGAIEERFGQKALAHLDPMSTFASVATFEALQQAGLIGHAVLEDGAVVIYGVGSGGMQTIEDNYHRLFDKKATSVHPLSIPKFMSSAASSQISLLFGIKGLAYNIASACASSAHAVAEGMHMIRAGRAEVAVVGGAEAVITYGSWLGWKAVRAMSGTACRPFSIGRDGMVLGEGAATLLLESEEHARARGAQILGEVSGAGASSDAFHITQPQGEGAEKAIRAALADASLGIDTPVLISAHGTGTEMNDKTEAGALNAVFGEHMAQNRVIATKSQHGHLFGGAGAIELILGVLAIERGMAPPVLNYLGPDPQCDVPLVLGEAARIDYAALVSNSFAFGGLNSVLVVKRV